MNLAPLIGKVIENGLIDKVFPYFEHEEVDIRAESGWIVANVAAGSSLDVNYLIDHGVIEKLMPLLYSSDQKVWSQAVWAYGNLAAESIRVRNLVNAEDVVKRIVALTLEQTHILKDSSVKSSDTLRHVQSLAWTIFNCSSAKPYPDFAMAKLFLPGLSALLECDADEETLGSTCWALSCLSDGNNERIQVVLDSGFFPSMMKIMEKDSTVNKTLRLAIIRVMGNLSSGNDSQTQKVVDYGGIKILFDHISEMYSKDIRREAAWALSNICAGSEEQIRSVVEYPNLLSSIVKIMNCTPYHELQKEIAWVLANIAEKEILSFTLRLHESGSVRALLSLLNNTDMNLVLICLGAIYQIGKCLRQERRINEFEDFKDNIENNGGLEQIEGLQQSASQQVYYKAIQILEEFFEIMEEDTNDDDQDVINEG